MIKVIKAYLTYLGFIEFRCFIFFIYFIYIIFLKTYIFSFYFASKGMHNWKFLMIIIFKSRVLKTMYY